MDDIISRQAAVGAAEETMRNPCSECVYYHPENNTCQSKKCATSGEGYVTWIDRRYCKVCR